MKAQTPKTPLRRVYATTPLLQLLEKGGAQKTPQNLKKKHYVQRIKKPYLMQKKRTKKGQKSDKRR